jgi:hypothetical protein
MSCEYTQDHLYSYVMGILDDKEEYDVASHVKSCDGCRARLAQLQQATMVLKDAFDEAPPEWLSQKVKCSLKSSPKRSSTWWVPWGVPALAGVAIVMVVLFIQPQIILKSNMPSNALRSSRIIDTPMRKPTLETGIPASISTIANRLFPDAFVEMTEELNINLKNPIHDRSIYDELGVKKEVARLLL